MTLKPSDDPNINLFLDYLLENYIFLCFLLYCINDSIVINQKENVVLLEYLQETPKNIYSVCFFLGLH